MTKQPKTLEKQVTRLNMDLVYHFGFEQMTDEWYSAKLGRFGGTGALDFIAKGKNEDKIGAVLQDKIFEKAGEVISQEYIPNGSGFAARRGIDLEPFARAEFQNETFENVLEVGYVTLGDYLGVSPDGLVGDKQGYEAKCLGNKEHMKVIKSYQDNKDFTGIKDFKKYMAQSQWGLFITGRGMWYQHFYNPNFKSGKNIIIEVKPLPEYQDVFTEKTPKVIERIKELVNLVGAEE